MYKAVHKESGEEILTLSQAWRERIGDLHPLDRKDLLVCPGCRQAVRVKAGARKRPHFAHKHLQGCSWGTESPQVLEGRAALYDWLAGQFPGKVDVEWNPKDLDLPRPADCKLDLESGSLVFWIVDTTLKLETREGLKAAFLGAGIRVSWILLSNLLRLDPNQPKWVLLSPTERDFLKQTPFDEIGRENRLLASEFGSTLHYLDVERGTLKTFRSLERVHSPNVFAGRCEEAPLAQIRVSPEGEIVYAGEAGALGASRSLRARQVERVRRWLEPGSGSSAARAKPQAPRARPEETPPGEPAAHTELVTCIFCGKVTRDWWTAWTEEGERLGKCRECLERGLG